MIVYILTNTLELGFWTVKKIYNGTHYLVYGNLETPEEREINDLKRELIKLRENELRVLGYLTELEKKIDLLHR